MIRIVKCLYHYINLLLMRFNQARDTSAVGSILGCSSSKSMDQGFGIVYHFATVAFQGYCGAIQGWRRVGNA